MASVHFGASCAVVRIGWAEKARSIELWKSVSGQPPRRGKTLKKTLFPQWDERLDFEGVLESLISEPMILEVYDQDYGVSALLGKVAKTSSANSQVARTAALLRPAVPSAAHTCATPKPAHRWLPKNSCLPPSAKWPFE